MKLIYCYIRKFRNIENTGFNFSTEFECHFNKNKLDIHPVELSTGEKQLLDPIMQNLSVIVGKTGSGKTNLLQLIGMGKDLRDHPINKGTYFLLYSVDKKENRFAIEVNGVVPKGIGTGKTIKPMSLIYFNCENGVISRVAHTDINSVNTDTIVINSYEKDSIRSRIYKHNHIDGTVDRGEAVPRFMIPYEYANAGIACWYAKEYLKNFSINNIKRNACLEIKSINWSINVPIDIEDKLLGTEYWFYHDSKKDRTWTTLKEVPDYFKAKRPNKEKATLKQQFIHDLLTDFALYLRKIADCTKRISEEEFDKRERLGIIKGSTKNGYFTLPDYRCDNLKDRIMWLCRFLDIHTDEFYGDRGLMYQIGSDINDLADIFEKFDDDCFEDGLFSILVEEIDFSEKHVNELFEIMSRYRSDQIGVFSSELLPFHISYLSSGEYQYANVMGSVMAFATDYNFGYYTLCKPKNIILLLDEPETYMHPEMCRNFIYWVRRTILERVKDVEVQVIISTHSPFMLSDFLPAQITKIDYDEDGYCRIVPNENQTFADDIHSIMSHEFFLDYSIGEHSRKFISDMIHQLNYEEIRPCSERNQNLDMLYEMSKFIGDSLIRESIQGIIRRLKK